MPIREQIKKRIESLFEEYKNLSVGKESLLEIVSEAETSETVYNSNAIENSTLTLKETEKILLEMELSRDVNLREIFEAKNLARVTSYIKKKASSDSPLNKEFILTLHKMLISGIDDNIAGRFRKEGEYVRVGTHIAPPPEKVDNMIDDVLSEYSKDITNYFLEKISKFHLDFETVHPFVDGNGRIGRVLINFQLNSLGFPEVIIRNKEKEKYYKSFTEYRDKNDTTNMDKVLYLALLESLHKRIAYLKGEKIEKLSDYAKKNDKSISALLNSARRQTIPAFREKGVWKIGT